MKEISIKTLELSNWRAQNRKITFSAMTEIEGRNESGKSTTKDAMLWLLTGYDSEDRFNYQLFDTTREYTQETSVPAYVEAAFSIDNIDYTLKRCARQGWVRKRNSTNYEKKPTDDYSFFIDGVEVSSGEYTRFVEASFCPIQHLKFILNINYYQSLDWKELRKVFADIIGEIQLSDYEGDFSEIGDMLAKHNSLDVIKDMLKSRIKPIRNLVGDKNNPGTLQTEIDALSENLPDISEIGRYEDEAAAIKTRIAELDALITGASDSIAPLIRKRNEQQVAIADEKAAVKKAKADYESEGYAREKEIIDKISNADKKNSSRQYVIQKAERDRSLIEKEIANLEKSLVGLQERRKSLLAKNKEIKSRVFSATRCSYCGQELPADMIEDARLKFNEEIQKEHERIVSEGKANNELISGLSERIDSLKARLSEPAEIPEEISTDSLTADLEKIRSGRIPFEKTEAYKTATAKISKMEAELIDIPVAPDTDGYKEEKAELTRRLLQCGEIIGRKSEYDRIQSSIERRREDLSKNLLELAKLDGLLDKAEDMEKQKMEIIRQRVNHLFDICDIEMEVRKKDGTMTPACNISVDNTPWTVLNTAARIAVGIDISNAFCRHNDVHIPLVLDNMEMVDSDREIPSDGRQTIVFRRNDCEFTVINR